MRSKFIAAVCSFLTLFTSCTSAGDGDKVLARLAAHYNKAEYKALYMMLSDDFREQASEAEITSFYTTNLRQQLGNIVSWKPATGKGTAMVYTVLFDNGSLDVELLLNGSGEIAGMQWLPSKQTAATPKKDATSIRSNNPKQTRLQLLIDSVAIAYLQQGISSTLAIGATYGGKSETFFYGTIKKGTETLPDNNTLFEIGSVTKTFTGIVLAHAINEGRIKAGDDIRKYLPAGYANLQYKGKPIKIVHLANHTSGLPRIPADIDKQPNYDPANPYKNYSKAMMLEYLEKVTLTEAPGTKNEYSNYAVALLGLILEDVYKQPLADLVNNFVLKPAQMPNTTFTASEAQKSNMATGYNEAAKETSYWDLGAFGAAGGLKSGLGDMMLYLAANMSETNPDFKLSHQQTFKDATIGVGLNWMISPTKENQSFTWHNGGTFGFTSFCGYIKDRNIGIVVLNNSGVNVDNVAVTILKEMKGMQ